MSYTNCGHLVNKQQKYCSECGAIIVRETNTSEFRKLLDTELRTPNLIYNALESGKSYKCELKYSQLVNSSGNFQYGALVHKSQYLKDALYAIETQGLAKSKDCPISKYADNLEKIAGMGAHYLTIALEHWKQRLIVDIPLLAMCGVKHTWHSHSYGNEQFEHILIALIENKISNPICGMNIICKIDPNMHELESNNKNGQYIPKLTNHKNKNNKYTFEIKELTEEDWRIAFCENIYNKFSQEGVRIDEMIKSNKVNHESIKKQNNVCQKELDDLLAEINCDIYYSSRNNKIYMEDELVEIFKPEMRIYQIDFKARSTLFKLKHINVYILDPEIDELFANVEERSKRKNTKPLTFNEGFDESHAKSLKYPEH